MANEELVAAVKKIVGLARSGDFDAAYLGYRDLFSSPSFASFRPEDQRQALRLMVFAKGAPAKDSPAKIAAYQSALPSLVTLVEGYKDPADHEMLGICYVHLGDEPAAERTFREGLTLERQHNATSDLCGAFMKRISAL